MRGVNGNTLVFFSTSNPSHMHLRGNLSKEEYSEDLDDSSIGHITYGDYPVY